MSKWVVDCRTEPYDVFIGRGSKWGNPYSHLPNSAAPFPVETREDAVRAFEYDLMNNLEMLAMVKSELKGKVLGCFCGNGLQCHGQVLARIANEEEQ